jgi:hypothetical protein
MSEQVLCTFIRQFKRSGTPGSPNSIRKESFMLKNVLPELPATQREPEEIELKGTSRKRTFQGHTLYWNGDRESELGVFLTSKASIAYWSFVPGAINSEQREEFEVYDSLDDLFAEQNWLDERKNVKTAIEDEFAAITGQRTVEQLEI